MTIDEIYLMACEYMAKTEMYDRSLTNCRSPWDKTEAFLDNPRVRRLKDIEIAETIIEADREAEE
jgi:hypothetical protein